MKYVKLCPQCGKPQSRIDFFQPFFNLGNICKSCGAKYTYESNIIVNVLIGLGISILIILGAEKIINWTVVVCLGACVPCVAIIFSPYCGRLKLLKLKEGEDFLLHYMMKPFLKFQCLILLALMFAWSIPIIGSLQESFFYRENEKMRRQIQHINEEHLRKQANIIYDTNKDLIDLLSLGNKFLFIFIIILSIFFIFNIVFYFKVVSYISKHQIE